MTVKLNSKTVVNLNFLNHKLSDLHIILSGEPDFSENTITYVHTASSKRDDVPDDGISIDNLYIEIDDAAKKWKGKIGDLIDGVGTIKNLYLSKGITELTGYEFVPSNWGYDSMNYQYYTNYIENIFLPNSVSKISPDTFKEIE